MRLARVDIERRVRERIAGLTQALEEAQLAEKAKDAFLANVSHELRTPLGAVIGLSALALKHAENPAQRDALEKIGKAGKHLSRIVNDLLDLSKIVAGRMEVEAIPFSLRAMVQRGQGVIAHKAEAKGLRLEFAIGADVPDVLVGDPFRLEQILLNLVGNAIKFTHAGTVAVRIALDAPVDDGVRLLMEVSDTGVGIRPEHLGRLFQPFTQTDVSMTRKYGGTGLGLALSQRLAEMMDGRIDVVSREGSGSTFTLHIRLGRGSEGVPTGADAAATQEILPGLEHLQHARILVVEDDAMNMEIVIELLQSVGIAPVTADNGQEAVEILQQSGPTRFDLVLMDIQMPVMDGLAATRLIRAWPEFGRLPIIAMTAHVLAHEKQISSAAGMNDHVCKPFDANDFYLMLTKWLPERRSAATENPRPPAAEPSPRLPSMRSVDTAAGLNHFFGNEARYRHWLAKFVEDSPGIAPSIRSDLTAGDSESAARTAHRFKGGAGTLGMAELQAKAALLETVLRAGAGGVPELRSLERAIEEACREIVAALAR